MAILPQLKATNLSQGCCTTESRNGHVPNAFRRIGAQKNERPPHCAGTQIQPRRPLYLLCRSGRAMNIIPNYMLSKEKFSIVGDWEITKPFRRAIRISPLPLSSRAINRGKSHCCDFLVTSLHGFVIFDIQTRVFYYLPLVSSISGDELI